MSTTTPSGKTRIPSSGDSPDVPRDFLNAAVDLEAQVKTVSDDLIARGLSAIRIQAGSGVTTLTNGDGYIPFPVAFKAGTIPTVTLNISDPAGPYMPVSFYTYTDNTKFAVRLHNSAGQVVNGAYRFAWIAVGQA